MLHLVFAEGAVYRQAAECPRSLIVVLGVWLIFGMVGLGGVFMVAIGGDAGFVYAITGAVILVFSVAMIWKTTRNYAARTKLDDESDA